MDSVIKRIELINTILIELFSNSTNDATSTSTSNDINIHKNEDLNENEMLMSRSVDLLGERMGLSDGSYMQYTKGKNIELLFFKIIFETYILYYFILIIAIYIYIYIYRYWCRC